MAARARAARAYAGHEQSHVAKALGISVQTYKRVEAGTRDLTDSETAALAAACGVPASFMSTGFDPLFNGTDVDSALLRVLREVRELWQQGPALPHGDEALQHRMEEAARVMLGQ